VARRAPGQQSRRSSRRRQLEVDEADRAARGQGVGQLDVAMDEAGGVKARHGARQPGKETDLPGARELGEALPGEVLGDQHRDARQRFDQVERPGSEAAAGQLPEDAAFGVQPLLRRLAVEAAADAAARHLEHHLPGRGKRQAEVHAAARRSLQQGERQIRFAGAVDDGLHVRHRRAQSGKRRRRGPVRLPAVLAAPILDEPAVRSPQRRQAAAQAVRQDLAGEDAIAQENRSAGPHGEIGGYRGAGSAKPLTSSAPAPPAVVHPPEGRA
jgi:hypothetical protein